jgi:phosphoglucomutase
MALHPLAGQPAPADLLIDVARLEAAYYANQPDLDNPTQRVAFGTSGHRGAPFDSNFTEAHILAITQAICEYRRGQGIDGPLFMGADTHAASLPAQRTALEVLAANGVPTVIQPADINGGFTPTPVISRAILVYNHGRVDGLADGIVITPSHNPPADGGFKYNPPDGGPADTDVTGWIENRANELLRDGNRGVKRIPYAGARRPTHHPDGFRWPAMWPTWATVIDMEAIRAAGLRIGVDPLGGAAWPTGPSSPSATA